MTFVSFSSSSSSRALLRGLDLLKADKKFNPTLLSSFSSSSSSSYTRHSFCFHTKLPSRFSSRSFNSSLSYQSPQDEACVQSDAQEHEDQQHQTRDKEVQRVRRAQFMLKMQSTTKQTEEEKGVPLRDVVADCARHSFKDYLKKANNDDVDAQMIVGKMYCAGYGVNKDLQKGQEWINKAQWKWKKKSVKLSRDSEDEEYFFI